VDARDRLRQYLEQRRELGEREFVLDGLTVEQAFTVLTGKAAPPERGVPGETPAAPRYRDAPPEPSRPRDPAPVGGTGEPADWRAIARAAEGTGAAVPPAPGSAAAVPVTPADRPAAPTPGLVVGDATPQLFAGPLGQAGTLDQIRALVASCQQCGLAKTALNPVPGEGNPDADFVCVGEAPGATEDEQGKPFVGAAGQLLTRILEAIQLSREEVFICNVLKHRPPGNRNPAPEEVTACTPFLVRQLELLRPKVILALGTFAAQTLLQTKESIGKLRSREHRYHGVPLVVTYHPAALLRNPVWKRPTWEDVQLARRILDRARAGA
jgi:DNA polymerase